MSSTPNPSSQPESPGGSPKRTPYEAGVAQRKVFARSALAKWTADLRHESVADLLERAMRDRVPALAKIKQERMAASPFGFFRGAAAVMAYDLSRRGNTGILAQLCGDAHVENLGAFAGADGRLIFDINDFDETIRGPFEWDVKRMAASILLAAGEARLKASDAEFAVHLCLDSYAKLMRLFARLPVLEVARYQVHRLKAVAPVSKILAQAERATPEMSLAKLTEATKHGRRFLHEPPLLRRVTGKEAEAVLASLTLYRESLQPERAHFFRQFRAVDVAFKVVGTGSVGLRDYCVYLEGEPRLGKATLDPLFLQIKQERPSVFAEYVADSGFGEGFRPGHEGRRVVEGQRTMQIQSDPLLGWTTIEGRDYLVRQLNDHKASVVLTKLKTADLRQYASVCGELLARGHARSGDAKQIAGYIGSGDRFRESVAAFADAYAKQTVADWKTFTAARS